ncbi:MAG: ester cyclase [Rhodospirillales bacterium]|jgi:predicted SnoaL-like aldol condensation-catalyzing enzyme|nr:ester cyclase [Rhodospirillales bacterium]
MSGEALERNKELVRRCIEVLWNEGAMHRAGEFLHPAVRRHHERNPDGDLHGVDAVGAALSDLRARAPDGRLEVVRLFGEGDRVMVYLGGEGTDADGTRLAFTVTAIVRIADGLITEIWLIADTLGLLQQVGAVRRFG